MSVFTEDDNKYSIKIRNRDWKITKSFRRIGNLEFGRKLVMLLKLPTPKLVSAILEIGVEA